MTFVSDDEREMFFQNIRYENMYFLALCGMQPKHVSFNYNVKFNYFQRVINYKNLLFYGTILNTL